MQNKPKILIHTCCAICSGYPISYLKDLGYEVCAYFYNPNIYPLEEYQKRLEAQTVLCKYHNVKLVVPDYNDSEYFDYVKGLEKEPEKGLRCDKCFELRLEQTAKYASLNGFDKFTTSLVISPHKNFQKITDIGLKIAQKYNLDYEAIDFKKKDGFLKTNKLSKELELYRQSYCGCKFSIY